MKQSGFIEVVGIEPISKEEAILYTYASWLNSFKAGKLIFFKTDEKFFPNPIPIMDIKSDGAVLWRVGSIEGSSDLCNINIGDDVYGSVSEFKNGGSS